MSSSSSKRNYSNESRSYYSRSSSYGNNNSSSSSRNRRLADYDRPLSSLLTERDFSSPLSSLNYFDDPFFFDRSSRKFLKDFDRPLRERFNDQLFDDQFFKDDFRNNSFDMGRKIPINHRGYQNSSTSRTIPIQYASSTSNNQREKVYKKLNDSDDRSFERNNQNDRARENRVLSDNWTPKQETPTRKRTSMTIFVRQPHVQYSDVPQHQRTMSTSSNLRTNYY